MLDVVVQLQQPTAWSSLPSDGVLVGVTRPLINDVLDKRKRRQAPLEDVFFFLHSHER